MKVIEFLTGLQHVEIFPAKEEISLETLYKSGSTTDISLKCSKSRKTHRKHCRRSQFLA